MGDNDENTLDENENQLNELDEFGAPISNSPDESDTVQAEVFYPRGDARGQSLFTKRSEEDAVNKARSITNPLNTYQQQELNSPVRQQYERFNLNATDPFAAAKNMYGEFLQKVTTTEVQQIRDGVNFLLDPIAQRLVNPISSFEAQRRNVDTYRTENPGFNSRPIESDYRMTMLGSASGLSMRGSMFQLQNRDYFASIVERRGSVELLTQTFDAVERKSGESEEDYKVSTATRASILIGNNLSQMAINKLARIEKTINQPTAEPKNIIGVSLDYGSIHAKIAYFEKEGRPSVLGMASNSLHSGYIGTQNQTATTGRSNTVEEMMFITNKGNTSNRILQQIKAATDAILLEGRAQIGVPNADALNASSNAMINSMRTGISPVVSSVYFRKRIGLRFADGLNQANIFPETSSLYLNQDIQIKLRDVLRQEVSSNNNSKVVLSVQYLENIFLKNPASAGVYPLTNVNSNATDANYNDVKAQSLQALYELSEQNRVTISTSNTSYGTTQGLFALLDKLNSLDNDISYLGKKTIEKLLSNKAFNVVPTQFMHSKSFAVLKHNSDTDAYEIDRYFIGSSNFSKEAFENNVEAGMMFDRDTLKALVAEGAVDENTLTNLDNYYRYSMSNLGSKFTSQNLSVENIGNAGQTQNLINTLLSTGKGVEGRGYINEPGKSFSFSRRYTQGSEKGNLTGLDIKLSESYGFSVTVGENQQYRRGEDGRYKLRAEPVVFFNKTNRAIVGAWFTNDSSVSIKVGNRVIEAKQSVRLSALEVVAGMISTVDHAIRFEKQIGSMSHGVQMMSQSYIESSMSNVIGQTLIDSFQAAHPGGLVESNVTDARDVLPLIAKDAKYREILAETKKRLLRPSLEGGYVGETGRSTSALAARELAINRLFAEIERGNVAEGIRNFAIKVAGEVREPGSTATAYNDLVIQMIRQSTLFSNVYDQRIKDAKRIVFSTVSEAFQQRHELGYYKGQSQYALPSFGVNQKLLAATGYLSGSPNTVEMYGFLLNPYMPAHGEILGKPGSVERPIPSSGHYETNNVLDTMGGIFKAADGVIRLSETEPLLRSMNGLGLITRGEYNAELKSIMPNLTDSEAKDLEDRVFQNTQQNTLYYFPYAKTEQISQRLKNLKSVRELMDASPGFARYARSFGVLNDKAEGEYTKFENILSGNIVAALPEQQFEILKKRIAEGKVDTPYKYNKLVNQLRNEAGNLNQLERGYIGNEAPRNVMISTGISGLSDFAYFNAQLANENGYIHTHVIQQSIDVKNLIGMTGATLEGELKRLFTKPTFVAATNVEIHAERQAELHALLSDAVVQELKKNSDLAAYDSVKILKMASSEQLQVARQNLNKEYEAFQFRLRKGEFEFEMRKGIYSKRGEGLASLTQIGTIQQGKSSFTIEGMYQFKDIGGGRYEKELIPFKIPAFSRREYNAISVLTDINSSYSGSSTYTPEFTFATLQDMKSGIRFGVDTGKGPFLGLERRIFQLFSNEKRGQGLMPTRVSDQEAFAILSPSQIKGFNFTSGLTLLESGNNNTGIRKLITNDGRKVAEGLSLLMLGDSDTRSILSEYLKTTGREQYGEGLKSFGGKLKDGFGAKTGDASLEIYGGLRSFIYNDGTASNTESIYDGLKRTVAVALGDERNANTIAARLKLQQAGTALLSLLDSKYGINLKQENRFTYNESNIVISRSAGLLAWLVKASQDVYTNIDLNERLKGGGLSELSLSDTSLFTMLEKGGIEGEKGVAELRAKLELSLTKVDSARIIAQIQGASSENRKSLLRQQAGEALRSRDYFSLLDQATSLLDRINLMSKDSRMAHPLGIEKQPSGNYKSTKQQIAYEKAFNKASSEGFTYLDEDHEAIRRIKLFTGKKEGKQESLSKVIDYKFFDYLIESAGNKVITFRHERSKETSKYKYKETKYLADVIKTIRQGKGIPGFYLANQEFREFLEERVAELKTITNRGSLSIDDIMDDVRSNQYGYETGYDKFMADTNQSKSKGQIRKSLRAMALGLNIFLPTDTELESQTGKEKLQYQLAILRGALQSNRMIQMPQEMGPNKIYVATGMQNKTGIEGHYAMSLTRKQLDLYNYSPSEADDVTSMQETLVVLGMMFETSLTASKVRSTYSMQRIDLLNLSSGLKLNNKARTFMRALKTVNQFSFAYSSFANSPIKNKIFGGSSSIISPAELALEGLLTKGTPTDKEGNLIPELKFLTDATLIALQPLGMERSTLEAKQRAMTLAYGKLMKEQFVGGKELKQFAMKEQVVNDLISRAQEINNVVGTLESSAVFNPLSQRLQTQVDKFKVDSINQIQKQIDSKTAYIDLQTKLSGYQATEMVEEIKAQQLYLDGLIGKKSEIESLTDTDKIIEQIKQSSMSETKKTILVSSLEAQRNITSGKNPSLERFLRKNQNSVFHIKYKDNENREIINKIHGVKATESGLSLEVTPSWEGGDGLRKTMDMFNLDSITAVDRVTGQESKLDYKRLNAYRREQQFIIAKQDVAYGYYMKNEARKLKGKTKTKTQQTSEHIINELLTFTNNSKFLRKDKTAIDRLLLKQFETVEGMELMYGNNLKDKFNAALNKDSGEDYIEGLELIYKYAGKYLKANADLGNKRSKLATEIQRSVKSTFEIVLPRISVESLTGDKMGIRVASPEEAAPVRGLLLGLDILQKMSLTFQDFSSSVLRSQQMLRFELAANQELINKVSAASMDASATITIEEYQKYEQLMMLVMKTSQESQTLIGNQETIRRVLADRTMASGASFIAMSSFLVGSHEVAVGKRIDSALGLDTGTGIRSLLATNNENITRDSEKIRKKLAIAKNQYDVLRSEQGTAKFFKQVSQGNYSRINAFSQTQAKYNAALQAEANYINSDSNINFNTQYAKLAYMLVTGETDTSTIDNRRVYEAAFSKDGFELEMLRIITGDSKLTKAEVAAVTKDVDYKTSGAAALNDRQGAPVHGNSLVGTAHQLIGTKEVHTRAKENNSLVALDVDSSNTLMLMSASGYSFTQLGDYDGDSFQIALTKLSQANAELNEAIVRKIKAEDNLQVSVDDKYEPLQQQTLAFDRNKARTQQEIYQSNLIEKMELVHKLKTDAQEKAKAGLLEYTSSYLAIPKSVLENLGEGMLPALIKQYRDTLAGLFDSADLHQKSLVDTMIGSITEKITKQNIDSVLGQIAQEGERNQVRNLIELETKTNRETDFYSEELGAQKLRLMQQYGSLMSAGASAKSMQKLQNNIVGSQIDGQNLFELQSALGASGTGLLGQTYNAIVPLLSLTDAAVNSERAMQNQDFRDKSLSKVIANLREAPGDNQALINSLGSLTASTEDSAAKFAELSDRHNTSFRFLLNVQQFLRDAAIKPKGKGTVTGEAAIFESSNQEYKGVVGLFNILQVAGDKRDAVLTEFLGKKVGAALEYSFTGEGPDAARKSAVEDSQGMRGFAALEIIKEYIGGKKSANEMFDNKDSVFHKELSAIRANLESGQIFGGPDVTPTNDNYLMHILGDMVGKFQSEFIYTNVLEADGTFGNVLAENYSKFREAMAQPELGFSEERLLALENERVRQLDQSKMTPQEKEVAVARAKTQGLLRGLIEDTTRNQTEGLVEDLTRLRKVNIAMKDIASGNVNALTADLEIASIALESMLQRGKLDKEGIANISETILNALAANPDSKDTYANLGAAGGLPQQFHDAINAIPDEVQREQARAALTEAVLKPRDGSSFAQDLAAQGVLTSSVSALRDEVIRVNEQISTSDSIEDIERYTQVRTKLEQQIQEAPTIRQTPDEKLTPIARILKDAHIGVSQRRADETTKVHVKTVEAMKENMAKHHNKGELFSLLATPLIFAALSGTLKLDADSAMLMLSNVMQAAAMSTSFKDSSISKMLSGKFEEANQINRRMEGVNNAMQRARVTESIRSNENQFAGLVKGVTNEALFVASSHIGSAISNKIAPNNLAARVSTEILSGVLGMAFSGALTARELPGTDYNARQEFDYILESLKNISTQVWQASERWFADNIAQGVEAFSEDTAEQLNTIVSSLSTVTENLSPKEINNILGFGEAVSFTDENGNELNTG